MAAPETSGLFATQQASLIRYRVGALSDASSTTSYILTRSNALAGVNPSVCSSIRVAELSSSSDSLAETVLCTPTDDSLWMTCR